MRCACFFDLWVVDFCSLSLSCEDSSRGASRDPTTFSWGAKEKSEDSRTKLARCDGCSASLRANNAQRLASEQRTNVAHTTTMPLRDSIPSQSHTPSGRYRKRWPRRRYGDIRSSSLDSRVARLTIYSSQSLLERCSQDSLFLGLLCTTRISCSCVDETNAGSRISERKLRNAS